MSNETTPAPAPAADAATGERTQGPDWRVAALLAENDNLSAEIDGWMRKAVAAEADRDRLALEVAALRGAAAEWAAARREYDALGDQEGNFDLDDEWRLRDAERKAAARFIRVLSATPPAAEAVTGAGGVPVWPEPGAPAPAEKPPLGPVRVMPPVWTWEARRGQSGPYWLLLSGGDRPRLLDVFWPSDGPIVAGLGAPMPGDILLWGPPFTDDPPDGWREALAALDQDQPQEADR